MRTNIVVSDALIKAAMRATGIKTKKTVVEQALKLLVKMRQQEAVRKWRGKLPWGEDLPGMRSNK